MFRKIRSLASMLATVFLLSACALNSYQVVNETEYPDFRKNFDVTIGWNVTQSAGLTAVEGYVRNNRFPVMEGLELWISLHDAAGSERAQKSFFIIPTSFRQDDFARFSVKLGSGIQPGDKLRFLYRYKGVEDNEEALSWMNSFEVPL